VEGQHTPGNGAGHGQGQPANVFEEHGRNQ
jgi:hypothetical protein